MKKRIERIDIVDGSVLNPKWRYPMFIVYMTDGSKYIENTRDHNFAKWPPKTQIVNYIGKEVEFEERKDSNCHISFMKLLS